ncbi:Serine/threonine protein kinase/ Zinc finger domain-containing protein [Giardia duodenalis assemblage B]|uniref:Serine/threonine protein kinase/ Zinc finger domain-containing protein n=1 Tax=Giardia duodenalis assemblage B TaxID=1394984 RepID=A0A132NTK2_GIAIN|nr:Serine/threonine protein kinase/ Zinc finger domain-containing protein [Giardia intestinalis assemblage B]
MSDECGICYEEFTVAATTNCLHTVCYSCFLRNRVLCGRKACLLCSDTIKNAIIYRKGSLDIDAIQKQLHHEHRYKNLEARYISRYHAIVTTDVMSEVNLLDLPPCPICGHHPNNKRDLQDHVRQEHDVEYCRVCIANKPSFMSDQLTYGRDALREHMACHPLCPLCKKPQYDNDSYKDHLLTEHHRCEICREHGVSDSYWRTANDLIEHHHNDHYVCTAPACKNVMVAFGTKDELLAHQVSSHPEIFTQRELEDVQMRLFCGTVSDSNSTSTRQRKPKKRDVTSLIGLTQFSLNNRIQRGELSTEGRFNNHYNPYNNHASAIAEDAVFEMHTKIAIRNSLETARLEKLLRDSDQDQIAGLTDNPPVYDPAIDLIERNKEQFSKVSTNEPDFQPVLVASMALPSPDYKQEQTNIYDAPPTATQATLDRLFNKTKDNRSDYSSIPTVFDTGTPTPLSHVELLKRTHERLGVVYKPSKKKKMPPTKAIEALPSTNETSTVHNDDPIQVNDLGSFHGCSAQVSAQLSSQVSSQSTVNRAMHVQQPEKFDDASSKSYPVDTTTTEKTSVQASLELYQVAAASNSNTNSSINQICGIPVVYKKKKKSQNQTFTS